MKLKEPFAGITVSYKKLYFIVRGKPTDKSPNGDPNPSTYKYRDRKA